MTYTLWRGDRQLGRFTERNPILDGDTNQPVGSEGILQLDVDAAELESVHQSRNPFNGVTMQHPRESMLFDERGEFHSKMPGFIVLRPVTQAEKRDVPADRLLAIRDADGDVIDTDDVTVQRMAIPDGVPLNRLHLARGLSDSARDIWRVSFVRARKDTRRGTR